MFESDTYTDLRGRTYSLSSLDDEERTVVQQLHERADSETDWGLFHNFWSRLVGDLYDSRGVPREESRRTIVYRIASDLGSRMGIAAGEMRMPDYRDELKHLIRERFPSRREFCNATGISEDMLSHVLARRKHLSMPTLNQALERIGYTLRIEPLEPAAAE